MTEGGYYQQKKMNPQAVGIVILLHGAALTALMMAKGDFVPRIIRTPTQVQFIPDKPVPPVKETSKKNPPPDHNHVTTSPTPFPPPPTPTDQFPQYPPLPPTPPPPGGSGTGTGTGPTPEPPPPPPPPRTFEPARAHANLGSYVSNSDYPEGALRNEEQGVTRFRLLVGPDGHVTDCTVTGSSGSSALDAATCRLMKGRARFTPARDANGNPTTDSVSNAIRWVLPDG